MKLFKISNILFALILFSCSKTTNVPLPITTSSPEALEYYNTGWYHWGDHDGPKQSEYMKKALSIDPDFILANLFVVEPDPNKRKQFRDRAIANKNTGNEAEKLLVEMFEAGREGQAGERIDLGKKLVERYPNTAQAYMELGDAYNAALEFDAAAENYKKAVKIDPQNVETWWRLASQHINVYNGQVLLPEKHQDKALGLKYVDKMISNRPDAAVGYQIRGNADRAKSDFESAKKWYQQALDKRRATGRVASGLLGVIAHNLVFNGEFELAQKYYDDGIAEGNTGNTKYSVAAFKIQSYLFNNDYTGAIQVSNQILNDMENWGLSQVQLMNGKAGVELRKFLAYAHNQQKDEAYESLMQRKKYSKMGMELMEVDVVRQRNYDATNFEMAAWYNILFGEYDEAEKNLVELYAIVSDIESPTAQDVYSGLMGMVTLFRGDAEGALDQFSENINTENYQYYSYFKAVALKAAGKEDDAMEIFEQLANYNFNGLGVSLVRTLAGEQLDS